MNELPPRGPRLAGSDDWAPTQVRVAPANPQPESPAASALKLVGILYSLCAVGLAVPAAVILRVGSLVELNAGLTVMLVTFILFAAAGLWSQDLRLSARTGPLAATLGLMAVVVSCAMAGAMVSTFALTRLDGVPRSVPPIAVAIAIALLALPSLFARLPRLREQLQAEIAGSPEQAAHVAIVAPARPFRPKDDANAGDRPRFDYKFWSDCTLVSLLPIAIGTTMLGPQGLSTLCVLLALLVGLVAAVEGDVRSWRRIAARLVLPLLLIGLLVGWAFTRTAMSPTASTALPILGWFTAILAAALFASAAAAIVRPGARWHWGYFPAVHLAAATILAIQLQFTLPEDVIREGSRLGHTWHYNRSAVFIVLLYPISIFAIQRMAAPALLRIAAHVAVAASVAMAAYNSESESAKFAFLAILAVLALAWVSGNWTRRLLGLGIAAAVLTAPFIPEIIEHVLQATGLWGYRPGTFAARVAIWEGVAQHIRAAPLVGQGAESVRIHGIVDAGTKAVQMVHHPHSFLLQTWSDLGFVGAVLMACALIALLALTRGLKPESNQMLLATSAGVLAVWAVSHGMWQSWYVGMCGVVFFFAVLSWRRSEARAPVA